MKEKFYVAHLHSNVVKFRALTPFESRNPRSFELSYSAHQTWHAAFAALVAHRQKKLSQALAEAARQERALAKVLSLMDGAPSKEGVMA